MSVVSCFSVGIFLYLQAFSASNPNGSCLRVHVQEGMPMIVDAILTELTAAADDDRQLYRRKAMLGFLQPSHGYDWYGRHRERQKTGARP